SRSSSSAVRRRRKSRACRATTRSDRPAPPARKVTMATRPANRGRLQLSLRLSRPLSLPLSLPRQRAADRAVRHADGQRIAPRGRRGCAGTAPRVIAVGLFSVSHSQLAMKIAIAGASGRMGRMLIETVLNDSEATLSGALDRAGAPQLGQDAGAFLG